MDLGREINPDPQLLHRRGGLASHLARIDHAKASQKARPKNLAAEENIGGSIEIRSECQILVDRFNSCLPSIMGSLKMGQLTVNPNFPFVGLVGAGEDSHQRALARPVISDQGDHFAMGETEIRSLQCLDMAEVSDDTPSLNERMFRHAACLCKTIAFAGGRPRWIGS